MTINNSIDSINQKIVHIANNYVKFRYCYLLYLVNIVLGFLFFVAVYFSKFTSATDIINDVVKSNGGQLIALLISFYIYLGFIKYSQKIGFDKLRSVITAIMLIAVLDLILSHAGYPLDWAMMKINLTGLSSTYLMFYIFKKIKNDEGVYFRKLN